MSETSIIRHRVVLAWANEDGPQLKEFFVQCANGGPWEVFVGLYVANARANRLDSLSLDEQKALENADIRLAYPVEYEPKGLVPKVYEVVGLDASERAADHFVAVDELGNVAVDSLGSLQRASTVCRVLTDENSAEAISQAKGPKT